MRKGFTLIEGLLAGGVILVLIVPMALGVLDTRRRARDAMRVSNVRQAQAALETYRAKKASYPATASELPPDDVAVVQALGYAAVPEGCDARAASICTEYRLSFTLEGAIGGLPGGVCTATTQGLSCSR